MSSLTGVVGLQTIVPPLFVCLSQELHKKAKRSEKEPLEKDQLFVVELAGELKRVCQVHLFH